ncbi:hypothetical protein I6N90_19175 [Paenibacillus sp. GSMTC-2017]|uniref:hypothetical protein n=1 Tax=Paenibacillus sp. GSMTC-2017 TaxID=2794350 RepID=UPI0018D73B88|nr:hypothetical protein [Paenibacillus sp. GSMTC-2017]MBH5319925.1 hypothetical protein [Paenibacillus sp. GSMTC-2017]
MRKNLTQKTTRDRYIYVLLSDTGTLFSKLIKGFTAAPYNHASLVLDADMNEIYSFGRKQANNPLDAGFVREDVYEGTYSHFPNTRCLLLRYEVTPEERKALKAVIGRFDCNKEHYSYNLVGLVGVLLNRDLKIKNSYFCSQFVAEALREGGINVWDRPSSLVTPNDFLKNNKFKAVYEGYLYDYPKLDASRIHYANRYQTRTEALNVN